MNGSDSRKLWMCCSAGPTSRPPSTTSWAVHEQLAGLYLALGNRAEAQRQAQQAWSEVPDRDRPGLGERLRAAGLLPA